MTPIDWLLSGDAGISSKTICAVMTGSKVSEPNVPYDNGDFGRCYRLLALFPEWRARLPEVAEQFPMWGPMVEAWDELTALYEKQQRVGRDVGLYDRMKALIDDGRLAAGWTKPSPGCWRGPGVEVVSFGKGASVSYGR